MGLRKILQSLCYFGSNISDPLEDKDIILRYREGGGCDLDSGAGVDQQWSPCGIVWVASPTVEPNSEDELHALIIMRNQLDKDTEEWEKLNYDIHTLRCARRQVFGRWRKILLQMGYQNEVDSLLEVNTERERENLYRASQLLHTLWEECSLFPVGFHTEEKYLSVMDRLISLDSAEEFIQLAKDKYPKTRASTQHPVKTTLWGSQAE
nr:melanoregulin-like isoform X2 [Paramormyrops kingsleyae]